MHLYFSSQYFRLYTGRQSYCTQARTWQELLSPGGYFSSLAFFNKETWLQWFLAHLWSGWGTFNRCSALKIDKSVGMQQHRGDGLGKQTLQMRGIIQLVTMAGQLDVAFPTSVPAAPQGETASCAISAWCQRCVKSRQPIGGCVPSFLQPFAGPNHCVPSPLCPPVPTLVLYLGTSRAD